MGYRVESYSLNELRRIAVPNAVSPSLFWALPIGHWQPNELNRLWQRFTENPGECNDFGLLLVKDMGRHEREAADVSLAAVGAKLSDLLPAGAERFVRPSAYQGESPRILVFSGGYPQPGWGVLVEWRQRGIHCFEDLIQRAISQLHAEDSTNELKVFREAAADFHLWQNLRPPTLKPNRSTVHQEILAGEKIETFLREAETGLQASEYQVVGKKLIGAMQGVSKAVWLKIPDGSLQLLLDAQRTLLAAASLCAVSKELLATEIEPKLPKLLADPSKRESAFRNLSSDAAKNALKACLHLRSKGIVGEKRSFHSWGKQIQAKLPRTLRAEIVKLRTDIGAKLVKHRLLKAQLEHEQEIAMGQWRQRSRKARERLHISAGKAAELQWELGPRFLVEFEHICRQERLWVRSIPWDPARMVGWKIFASQVRLDLRDLQIAAQELVPGATGTSATNGNATAVANGSYFTDYVHYIAMAKPGFSPRTVTRDLVARLLRPAEMITLIESHGGQTPAAVDALHLADDLLYTFGWRQSDAAREKPLAGCVTARDDNKAVLVETLSGNDLRIVLESFGKDIVDVIVGRLGYSHPEVWRAIRERIPSYRSSSRAKDWEEEVCLMTVGAAVMIVGALGPLAFPEHANDVHKFATDLRELANLLNPTSHHREGAPISSEAPGESAALILQVLGEAKAFLGDLPWHLDATFSYGEQPKVLSGEAWSHGSPTPRFLRVIVWTGTSPGAHVTLWDRTRSNPIVTDPVFIVRPRLRG